MTWFCFGVDWSLLILILRCFANCFVVVELCWGNSEFLLVLVLLSLLLAWFRVFCFYFFAMD